MGDTQWPRFEVFQQDRKGQPHHNAGSVHAPDEEMALQNARDVFVRRPNCNSLWVVPAEAIFARSIEEIQSGIELDDVPADTDAEAESYYVFQKTSQRRSLTYVTYAGEVIAHKPEEALEKAITKFGEGKTYVWWVCPKSSVLSSGEEENASLFAPATDKKYRMPQSYHVLREMMQVKSGRIGLSDIEDA